MPVARSESPLVPFLPMPPPRPLPPGVAPAVEPAIPAAAPLEPPAPQVPSPSPTSSFLALEDNGTAIPPEQMQPVTSLRVKSVIAAPLDGSQVVNGETMSATGISRRSVKSRSSEKR